MSDDAALTEFLEARIAEDETVARAAICGQDDPENGWGYEGKALTPHVGVIHEREQAEHIIRWHPARVMADCKAKRQILAAVVAWEQQRPSDMAGEFPAVTAMMHYPLRALAAIWADHPDYREEWRP